MKLTRWKLVYIFLFIFLIFQTNMVLANNIVVPHEWYRYQGASDSDNKGHDCGPACVAMAIQFIKNTFVPIRDIRNYIEHSNAATSKQLKNSLQHWGISYNHLSAGSQNVIDAVNNRNHIVICPVKMLCFSPGLDIDSESDDDPALHYDRYSSFSGGHFIIVKGISDDGNWIIVYDPGVWGSYPYPKYWYSNGEPKGKERYYKLSEFSNAINSRGIEILAEPQPIITSPLKITPSSPYCIGDTINAEFTITNQDKLPINFSVLTIGGRDPDNQVADFTHRQNITLEPFESYNYQGTLTLNKVGNYHFFCAYQTPNDEWNTNIDLGSGLTDEDRTRDIVVKEKPSTFGGSNIIPPTATATALVIDHSGSMGDKRKLELAQEAARSYIDSVPEEDYVSVAGFSADASSIVGLSSIKTSKEKLKQCILSLHSTSSTNIGAGLRVGMEQIFVEGQRPQKPIILLLSDGMHNTGELWPWVEECTRKQVKVYTVAFGSDADQVTLCKIAYQTGGRCFPAGIKNLSHIYHKANIYVHNNSTLFASSDWLKPGQELKYKVDVPSDFRNLTFFTNWQGSSIQTVIVKPDGSFIYPSSQMGDYQKGNTYSIFRVPAETGIWELRLSGQDLPQEGEQINVSISGKSEIYSNFLTFQPEYKQGQRVLIRVEVADVAGNQKIPLENIKVKAKIEGPTPQLLKKVGKGKFEINPFKILIGLILKQQEIDLYDDGAHDDYDSKDGIYGGTFLGGDILGPYLVTAIIEGQSQGKIISRQIQESFQIGPIQDNKLTISDFIQIRYR